MFTFESRVRYSETDENKLLTVPKLIDYFQDCSTFQSEDLGVGLSYMEQIQMVWVVASWQLEIKRLPHLGERIVIGTLPYAFKAFLGYRNFCMMTEEGEVLCVANSLWSLLSTQTGKPVNAPKDMMERYPIEEKLEMQYAGRKITLSADRCRQEAFVVEQQHVDANHHVNNGQYVSMAAKFLPLGFEEQVKSLRVEYKMQAYLGDVLVPAIWMDNDTCVISLEDQQGKPYAVVEFSKADSQREGAEGWN